jgi:hypothetical protein
LYRLEIEVVAITPFMFVVKVPAFAESVFELIKEEVAISPFTILVKVFTAEFKTF